MILTPMHFDELSQWKATKLGHRPREYVEMKESVAAKVLDAMRQWLPEVNGRIEVVSTFTGLTYRDYTGTWEGSAFGVKKSLPQLRSSRIEPKMRVKNLFIAGQSNTLPGIAGTVIASVAACGAILGSEYLIGKIAKETE